MIPEKTGNLMKVAI